MTGLPKAHLPINAEKVDEGMYKAPGDILYIDAAELLVAHGYEPTMENQAWIGRLAAESGAEQGVPLLFRELQRGPR